jgi:hypothetical protein
MRAGLFRRLITMSLLTLLLAMLVPGITSLAAARVFHAGSPPYKVELVANNFGQNLFASAIDLSNPQRALFSLQNATPFWYGVSLQSSPAGMQLIPADASDLVTTTFYGTIPLLPASGVLPAGVVGRGATLKLAITFTGPGEQTQLTLNPFDTYATLMDTLSLLLRLLGERADGVQIGLLAPSVLKIIFDDASTMRYLQSLASDYALLLQGVSQGASSSSSSSGLFSLAYTCARDLVGLVSDTTEREQLAEVLWLAMGKTIARASIVTTLSAFGQAQFGLGMLGYLKDEAQVAGGAVFQQNNPTLLLQSVAG